MPQKVLRNKVVFDIIQFYKSRLISSNFLITFNLQWEKLQL